MNDKQLNDCPNFFPFDPSLNLDQPPGYCPDPCADPTQQTTRFGDEVPVQTRINELLQKYNLGKHFQCDPMTTGQITNRLAPDPNRRVINKYPRAIRGLNEGMLNLFGDFIVIDDFGTEIGVPIIWGTQERAVMFAIGTNVRPDNSLVVDRLALPLLSLVATEFNYNMDRYTYHYAQNFFRGRTGKPAFYGSELKPKDTIFGYARGIPVDIGYQLTAWTYFLEDMYQILEQLLLKFSPIAYIRTQGNQWVTIVKLDGIANNIDLEPGNAQLRMIKFQFNFTAEHYIPQPVSRYRSVLRTKVDFTDAVREGDITEVLSRFDAEAISDGDTEVRSTHD